MARQNGTTKNIRKQDNNIYKELKYITVTL